MAWDKDKPAASTSLRSSNPEILANWDALETALNREHEYSTGGTVADQAHHKKGSARCFIQDAAPTTRRDTTAFTAEDNGSLWIDTNSSPDNQFNVLTDYSGPTWTPISTEVIAVLLASNRIFAGTLGVTGNFDVNTNKFTVAAATGNALVAGTLDVAGNIDPTTYETTNGGFLDEDDMASDAANKTASQQSIKKFIEDQDVANLTRAGKVEADGTTIFNTTMTAANTFQDLDLSAKVGSNIAWVYLEIVSNGGGNYACKPKGEGSATFANHVETSNTGGAGTSSARLQNGNYRYILCQTDSSGVIQHGYTDNSDTLTIKLLTFIK